MAYKAALSPLMSEMGRWKQFKKDTKAAESILLQAVCISAAVAPGGHCNATAQPAAHTHTHRPIFITSGDITSTCVHFLQNYSTFKPAHPHKT